MKKSVYQKIDEYNKQFEGHSKAYPARIKQQEVNCLFHILRAWAAQAADDLNRMDMVNNTVSINNRTAQGPNRDLSNVGRYLGKLAAAGFIGGIRAGEKSPLRYQCQFSTDKGKGFGWMPVKDFHGTNRDYEILLNPEIMPFGAIPLGVSVILFDKFPDKVSPKNLIVPSPKIENFHLIQELSTFRNKGISYKALASQATPTEQKEEKERQPLKARKYRVDGPTDLEPSTEKTGFIEKKGKDLQITASEIKKLPADLLLALVGSGHEVKTWAMTLVSSYLSKLAPIMPGWQGIGRVYSPSVIEKGYLKALQMLSEAKNPYQMYLRMIQVIDRMQDAMKHNPQLWVNAPHKYFDKDYKYNIWSSEKVYLIPWEKTGKELKALCTNAEKIQLEKINREKALTFVSKYHGLAFSLKNYMIQFHRNDNRLKKADLTQWAVHLRLMCERDNVGYDEAVRVAKWMLLDKSQGAKFWRLEAKGHGIKSARQFRINYQKIRNAYSRYHAQNSAQANQKGGGYA